MSTHQQKYLFESGLIDPFTSIYKSLQEMSDKALDILAPEEGLEVSKKAKLKGKLDPKDDWSLVRIEYREGAHGEAEYETCANCSKSIRYVCMINGSEDIAIVGPDCALTLLKIGDDIKVVEDFVGKRVKKNKFVKNATKYFEEQMVIKPEEEAAFERVEKLIDGGEYKGAKQPNPVLEQIAKDPKGFATFQNMNSIRNGTMLVEAVRKNARGIVYPNTPLDDAVLLCRYSTKKWIEYILTHKIPEIGQVFERLWAEQITLRDKKQFFNPTTTTSLVSDFLAEFKETIGGEKSIFD